MGLESNLTISCLFLKDVRQDHTGFVYGLEIFTCVLNSVLPIAAVTGNLLTIFVIYTTPMLHTQQNVFLCSLAASNFVLAAIAQPAYVIYKVSEILENNREVWCDSRIAHWWIGFLCAGVSILTITATAVDRYLAIYLNLTYVTTVTVKRCVAMAISFWIFAFAIMLSVFFVKSDRYWTIAPVPVLFFSLVITATAYAKIFRILRRHQRQIHIQVRPQSWHDEGNPPMNIKKYKKSAITTIYILALFIGSNIPILVAMVMRIFTGYTSSVKLTYELAATVVYVSSSLNPLLYCWRMKDIRKAVLSTLRKGRNFICTN